TCNLAQSSSLSPLRFLRHNGTSRLSQESPMPADRPPLLAVLIDADNISAKYAEAMFEEIASLGEASIRRIYGDFAGGGPQGWNKDKIAALAIVPHQQFANTSGKNA